MKLGASVLQLLELVQAPRSLLGCEPTDVGKTIHPYPTLGESIGLASLCIGGGMGVALAIAR